MIDTDIKGKHILVTGASSGIGESIVCRLSQQGATVIMIARSEEKMRQIASGLPNTSYVFPFDLRKTEEIEGIFKCCIEYGFKLDGFVHCAGIRNDLPLQAVSVDMMREMMDIHYYAYIELSRHFTNRKYSNEKGSVVVLSSLAATRCDRGMSQYSAAKSAVNAATITMSKEFIHKGIRFNAIAPGFVDTEMTREVGEILDGFYENLNQNQPLGIIPTEHIAILTEYLLSDASGYITGDIIPVTAGLNKLA